MGRVSNENATNSFMTVNLVVTACPPWSKGKLRAFDFLGITDPVDHKNKVQTE